MYVSIQQQNLGIIMPRPYLVVFLFVVVLKQLLADLIDIARSDGEYNIAGLSRLTQTLNYLAEGFVKPCTVYVIRQVLGADAESVFLTGGKYLGKVDDIRPLELTDKVIKQRLCAAVGVRLEYNDGALVA